MSPCPSGVCTLSPQATPSAQPARRAWPTLTLHATAPAATPTTAPATWCAGPATSVCAPQASHAACPVTQAAERSQVAHKACLPAAQQAHLHARGCHGRWSECPALLPIAHRFYWYLPRLKCRVGVFPGHQPMRRHRFESQPLRRLVSTLLPAKQLCPLSKSQLKQRQQRARLLAVGVVRQGPICCSYASAAAVGCLLPHPPLRLRPPHTSDPMQGGPMQAR